MQRRWVLGCVIALLCGCGSAPGNKAQGLGGAGSGTNAGDGAGAEAGATGSGAGVQGGAAGTSTALAGATASGEAGQGSTGSAGDPTGAAGSTAGSGSEAPTTGPFPPVTDFEADGPFTAKTVNNTGPGGTYTVYMPEALAPDGAKNPIVGWMSGGSTSHTAYALLPRLATHGFVVVASNSVPGIGQEVALGQEIIAGIDWAIAENARAGSMFEGKLDTTKIASMGYSMGSLATFTIAADLRLTTTVHISGGNMAPERVNNLHAPAAFLCGTPGDASCNLLSPDCDIAGANCATDFENAKTPVFYGEFDGGHLGILTAPLSEQIGGAATAWLRYKLMGDTTLEPMFVGPSCELCSDPAWKVQQKLLP